MVTTDIASGLAVSALCKGHDVTVGRKTFTLRDGRVLEIEPLEFSGPDTRAHRRTYSKVNMTVSAFIRLFMAASDDDIVIHALVDVNQLELVLA